MPRVVRFGTAVAIRQQWHAGCIRAGVMEIAIALIVLVVGVMLEAERPRRAIRIRVDRDR